jgi:hypothetical protein
MKLLLTAACVVASLCAQSGITFSISKAKPKAATEPGWKVAGATDYLLTVKKSDPRAVDMFSFEVVDANGKFQSKYYLIHEDNVEPVIPADATDWTTHPFLGNTTADVSVRNPKVVFAGDDHPIVNKRNDAIKAGRTFHVLEAVGPPEQTEK